MAKMKAVQTFKWIAAGVIFILISIPPILKLVPPNQWYGFRVAKAFTDEIIWYAANRVMGYDLLIAGVLIVIAALATAKLLIDASVKTT